MTNKLVYILNHFSHESSSHFYHILNLLEKMADRGIEIALIIEKCDDLPEVNHPNLIILTLNNRNKVTRYSSLFKLLYQLNKKGYNKIFVRITSITASCSILMSWFTKQKTYYWLSGTVLEQFDEIPFGIRKIRNYIYQKLPYYFVKNNIDCFVTGPETMIDYYATVGRVKREKIKLLYNDIDLSRFSNLSINNKQDFVLASDLGVPEGDKIVLFVHRFSPVRKTKMYIPYIFDYFFKECTDTFTFLMVGGGPDQKEIENEISKRKYAHKVIFIGSVPNTKIHLLYKKALFFINPTFAEGFPRVMIEAMASGLPIVTTDAGGITDIIGEKQREFMVDKMDVKSFAQKMVILAKDKHTRKELSEENIQTVKKFDTLKVADMYIDTIMKNEN